MFFITFVIALPVAVILLAFITPDEALSGLITLFPLALVVFLSLYLDCRMMLQYSSKREVLINRMQWDKLMQLHRSYIHTWRPAARLLIKFFAPGVCEAQYANDLNEYGQHTQAIAMSEQAVTRGRNNKKHRDVIYAIRAQVLASNGRYDEARAIIDNQLADIDTNSMLEVIACEIDRNAGQLAESLSLAQQLFGVHKATISDGARIIAASSLMYLGRFDEGIAILQADIGDGATELSDKDVKRMVTTGQGKKVLEEFRAAYSTQAIGLRQATLAQIYQATRRMDDYKHCVDRLGSLAEKFPMNKYRYLEHQAVYAAMSGDPNETPKHLEALISFAPNLSSRPFRLATAVAKAQCHHHLNEHDAALQAIDEVHQIALHPIDKHAAAFLHAEIAQAAGHHDDAVKQYQRVVADGFGTYMHHRATEALQGHNG